MSDHLLSSLPPLKQERVPAGLRDHPRQAPSAWGGVFALALGAFALVASEFMPVSLLTSIAQDLHVSEGRAGQSIAVSGAFALFTSLSMGRLAGALDRKILLLALTGLMAVSGSIAAWAPTYPVFMVARACIGIAIGGFWSMSAATAMRLVRPSEVPKALAIVNGGNALATVIAAPLGSFLGAMLGWRGAFFLLVPVALAALAWNALSLPLMPNLAVRAGARTRSVFGLLRSAPVALGMAGVSLFFMGQFALFTYLRPFLEQVTHAGATATSLLLLLMGASGFIGTLVIGSLLKTRLYPVLAVIPLLMAALAAGLLVFGSSLSATAVLLACWGLLGTSAPVAWWTWLARSLPYDAENGGGLMVAVVQLAIAAGAALGGRLFDGIGYRATFAASAAIFLLAAGFAVAARRAEGAEAGPAAPQAGP
jgi:predicted MFS family arabinose efflux permease